MPGATAFIARDRNGRVQPLTTRQRRAAELASEDDRKWFELNPSRSHRLRAARADELPTVSAKDAETFWIVCRQVRPGVRLRWPFDPPPAFPLFDKNEAFAHAIFDSLQKAGGGYVPLAALMDRWRMLENAGRA